MSFEKKFVTGEVLQQVAQGVRDKIKGEIVNNLESTDINKPLSANQGKILQDTKLGKNEKHEQTSDTITSMTGYEKAGTGVVLPTDSLNQAIGKLEVKADKALYTANNAIPKDNIVNDLTTGGTDNVLSAEQGKGLKQLIDSETSKNLELLKGNSGIKDVFYIQDAGTKEIGKGYVDKVTKELYICLVENSDTDIKLGKFELATNIENRFRLMRLEQKLGVYQPVYGIKELKVSRDENNSSTSLTYTQK